MPANRMAALSGTLTAAVGAIIALVGVLESDTAKAIVMGVSIAVIGAIVIVFLLGSQKHEARTARAPSYVVSTSTSAAAPGSFWITEPSPDEEADLEPGDPDALPDIQTTEDVPPDGDDSVHAGEAS